MRIEKSLIVTQKLDTPEGLILEFHAGKQQHFKLWVTQAEFDAVRRGDVFKLSGGTNPPGVDQFREHS